MSIRKKDQGIKRIERSCYLYTIFQRFRKGTTGSRLFRLINIQKMKHGINRELGNILLEWLHQARGLNIPVNGNMAIEKAHGIARRFNIDIYLLDLVARFKESHGHCISTNL